MLNETSIAAVNGSRFSQQFVKPLYSSYSFANLPKTIQYLLTGLGTNALSASVLDSLPTRYNKVVLFFVDAFGWRFFEQYADRYPLLKAFRDRGVVSKLTSQFPSTTSAHVTCINTGLNIAQSGVYEWNYYEPLVDAVIAPLRFSYARDADVDTLRTAGIAPEAFYPTHTLYQTLQRLGVQSHTFQPAAYARSTYSNLLFRGVSSLNSFKVLEDALLRLTSMVLMKEQSPAYYLFYYDRIDAACHLGGPNSQDLELAVAYFFQTLEQFFYRKLYQLTGDTLLILTADHGQVEVSPERTFYLNREIPDFERFLRKNRQGVPVVPAGSARDMFLHVLDEHIDEVVTLLRQRLLNRAEVYLVEDLVRQNFFGSTTPSSVFLNRVGNVVILPYAHETVWWFEPGHFDMHFRGHHGGLTPQELEIPLLLLPL